MQEKHSESAKITRSDRSHKIWFSMYLFLANAKINLNGVPKKKILWDSSCSTVELTIIKYNKLFYTVK